MDQRSLYFRGDIHGDFKRLATRLSLNDLSNATITQVADFGIGFNPDERKDLKILNQVLQSLPITMSLSIRICNSFSKRNVRCVSRILIL